MSKINCLSPYYINHTISRFFCYKLLELDYGYTVGTQTTGDRPNRSIPSFKVYTNKQSKVSVSK